MLGFQRKIWRRLLVWKALVVQSVTRGYLGWMSKIVLANHRVKLTFMDTRFVFG